jgi:putative ABC transport system permease protein
MIAVMALGIFSGFLHFIYWGVKERIIHVGMGQPEGTGHFQIFHPKYFESDEPRYFDFSIANSNDLINKIEIIPEVAFATPRIDMIGLISDGERTEPAVGFAIVPEKEKRLPGIFGPSRPYLKLEKEEDGVVLGKELARKMKVRKGDYLIFMSNTVDGELNAIDLKFVGTISTGFPEVDSRFILVNLQSAMNLFQTDRVRKIAVVMHESSNRDIEDYSKYSSSDEYFEAVKDRYTGVDMEKAENALVSILGNGNFTIKTWRQLNSYYDSVEDLYNTIFGFIGTIMAIFIILSVYNIMFMAVIERTREIGTLIAIGTPRRFILLLFLIEGLIIACMGGIMGYGGTYGMAKIISNAGFIMPPPPGGTTGYPLIISKIYIWWFYIILFMMFNTVLACFMPAYRASRMAIVKALNYT